MLTRRDTTRLLLAGTAVSLLPAPALARSRGAWERHLRRQLKTSLLPGCDGKLTLLGFDKQTKDDKVWMQCDIRLDWPPGYRTRRFEATEPDEDASFQLLYARAMAAFDKAWPGCLA